MHELENGRTDAPRKSFVGYEYKTVTADMEKISFFMDGYECFGWEPDENLYGSAKAGIPSGQKKQTIRLKRDRRIINKMELTRLQRNFEACINEIETMEKAKTSRATVWALVIACIGTVFMTGGTFAATAQPPHYILMTVLAVPGFLGWILPYFIYRKIAARQTEKMTPLIETKYDEICEICERGNKLLY